MALIDTAIRKLRPTDKLFKLGDSAGLYLLIKPNGSKLWYMKYRIDGKEKKLAFGPSPDVSLLKARQLRDVAHAKVREGADPSIDTKIAPQNKKNGQTFRQIAMNWHGEQVTQPFIKKRPRFAGSVLFNRNKRIRLNYKSLELFDLLRLTKSIPSYLKRSNSAPIRSGEISLTCAPCRSTHLPAKCEGAS